jgi:hypothetical protein
MAFDGTEWIETTPTNNDLANEIDDNMRDIKKGIRSRMALEHNWPTTQTGTNQGGFHAFVTLTTQTSVPSLVYGTDTQASSIFATASGTGIATVCHNSQGGRVILNHSDYANGGGVIPKGGIIIWSGAVSAIPAGWQICDGTNSTPDLTDRFVIHADADAAGTNDVGDTGGDKTHILTGAESGTSAHTHPFKHDKDSAGGAVNDSYAANTDSSPTTDSTSTASVSASTEADASSAHTNRDLYYALAYIMKL